MITGEQVRKLIKKNPLQGYRPLLLQSIKEFYKEIYIDNYKQHGVKKGKTYGESQKNCIRCILEQYSKLKEYVDERTN